jgi:hypothetical protein
MTRRENYMVEKIDRAREAPAIKAERQRRAMYLKAQARRAVTSILADIECADERAAILGDLIDVAAEYRWPILGRVETATALNSVAADVCAVFRLPRAIKNAAAEQAFAKLTRAANDRGADD